MAIKRFPKKLPPLQRPGGGSAKGGIGIAGRHELKQDRIEYLKGDALINNALKSMGLEARFGPRLAGQIFEAINDFMENPKQKGDRDALISRLVSLLGSTERAKAMAVEFTEKLVIAASKVKRG